MCSKSFPAEPVFPEPRPTRTFPSMAQEPLRDSCYRTCLLLRCFLLDRRATSSLFHRFCGNIDYYAAAVASACRAHVVLGAHGAAFTGNKRRRRQRVMAATIACVRPSASHSDYHIPYTTISPKKKKAPGWIPGALRPSGLNSNPLAVYAAACNCDR